MNFSTTVANAWLDAVARNTSYAVAAVWVKLYVGDPGASGTSHPAVETTRKQATFGSAASGRVIANTVALSWTTVAATETYTYIGLWDANAGGTFLGSAPLAAPAAVNVGDNFSIDVGDLVLTIN